MNKKDILYKLGSVKNDINFDEVIIISGASLVLQGVIEKTNDIDLSCTKAYYNQINWPIHYGAFDIDVKSKDCFDISYNLYYPDDVVIVEGYKCMGIKRCYDIKKRLNREKDKEVIIKLENMIKKQ